MNTAAKRGWTEEVVRFDEPDDLNGSGHRVWRLIGGAENDADVARKALKTKVKKIEEVIQNGPTDEETLQMMTHIWPACFEAHYAEAWQENKDVYLQQMAAAAAQMTNRVEKSEPGEKIMPRATGDWHRDAGNFIKTVLDGKNQLVENDEGKTVVSADFMAKMTGWAPVLKNPELWNDMIAGSQNRSPSFYKNAFAELGRRFPGIKGSIILENLQERYNTALHSFARRPVVREENAETVAVGGSRYSNLVF